MEEHPLLPAIHDTFAKGDPEAHVMALGRRFPALCKLLATLVTVSPPRSNDANVSLYTIYSIRTKYMVTVMLGCGGTYILPGSYSKY